MGGGQKRSPRKSGPLTTGGRMARRRSGVWPVGEGALGRLWVISVGLKAAPLRRASTCMAAGWGPTRCSTQRQSSKQYHFSAMGFNIVAMQSHMFFGLSTLQLLQKHGILHGDFGSAYARLKHGPSRRRCPHLGHQPYSSIKPRAQILSYEPLNPTPKP